MSLTLAPQDLGAQARAEADRAHALGYAYGRLVKSAGSERPVAAPVLTGRLVVSQSGWLLLTVPNALVHGLFDAVTEPGVELPPGHQGQPFNAHVSVMTKDEVDQLGGPQKISERGHSFRYQLGPIKTVTPEGWSEMSKAWFVEVQSPDLKNLRKSYGLSPLPKGDHEFHITVCVRRKKVLSPDPTVAKAAGSYADPDHPGGITPGSRDPYENSRRTDERGQPCPPGECCPHCGARLERGDDGRCNRCGETWPNGRSKLATLVAPPALVDETLAVEDALDAAIPPPPPRTVTSAKPQPPVAIQPRSPIFQDVLLNAAIQGQLGPALKTASILPNNAAMVTALLPLRRPAPPAVLAPRRRRPVPPEPALAQAEATDIEDLIPRLRARRAALRARLALQRMGVSDESIPLRDRLAPKLGAADRVDPGYLRQARSDLPEPAADQGLHSLRAGAAAHGLLSGALQHDGPPDGAALAGDQGDRLGGPRVPGLLKDADFAPGLPHPKRYGNLQQIQPGQLLDYIVQHHRAHKAGPHYDVRFGTPHTGLFSWAVPRGVPVPGEKHLAIQQPVHRYGYKNFEGEIPRGTYGAGTVKKQDEGHVLITKIGPDHIHFTTAHRRHPERFVLLKPSGFGRGKDWLLTNVTPTEKVPFEKLHYKRIPAEQVEPAIRRMGQGGTVEAKLDGASQLVHLLKGHAEHLSFRTSKETGRPIFHTERVLHGNPTFTYPRHLEGSVLKGELYASPAAGQAGGPQDVSTLLNSSIGRSLQLQRERGVKIKNMIYDIQRYGKTPIHPANVPRPERRQMMEEVVRHLPADTFHVSEPVHDTEAGIQLYRQIAGGAHPLTQEGVVIHPAQGIPQKVKLFDEHDVVLRGTFPGEGKRAKTIGGFTYSHTPQGPVVGKVGTGLSDAFLNEVVKDPGAYVGRTARLKAQERLPSGSLRAPVFLSLHEDRNAPQKIAAALDLAPNDPPESGAPLVPAPALIKPAGVTGLLAVQKRPDTYGPDHKPSWTKHVMLHYDATKPPKGIFTRSVAEIVAAGHDPKIAPKGPDSWQKMVLFHRNRGGARLGAERRQVLQEAIQQLSQERKRQKHAALRTDVEPAQPQQTRVAKRVNAYDPRVLVYHGLGSGKTRAALMAAEESGQPYAAVVPAALRPNFHKEQARWTDQKTPSDVLSYTQVGSGQRPQVRPETLILDEVQRLRNPQSVATQGVEDLARQARRLVLLSGTPIVNQPSDLAVPLSLLTGKSMTTQDFNQRFVGRHEVSPGLWGRLQGVPPVEVPAIQHEQELEDMLRGHVDYHPSRAPQGVQTNEERVVVDMSPAQKDFYRLMWNQLPWLTRWKMQHDYPMTTQELKNLQSFLTGPRQAALSLYPFQGQRDAHKAFQDSAKLTTAFQNMQKTLGDSPQAKVLVYSNFIDAGLTPYAAALEARHIPYSILHGGLSDRERQAQLAAYNQGKSRVLLLGPAASEGISAQGTQLIQLLDPHWNEARMGQAQGRGLRFDSHEGLPENLRHVKIQRYIAKLPDPGFFGRLFGGSRRPSADEFLESQSQHKEELNNQFREVLKRVGSEPPSRPWWSLFG